MALRMIKLAEVVEVTKLSRTGIYEQMRAGTFPKSRKIGVRAVAWRSDDIDAWIDSLKEVD
jgi:prophage regulatory protein